MMLRGNPVAAIPTDGVNISATIYSVSKTGKGYPWLPTLAIKIKENQYEVIQKVDQRTMCGLYGALCGSNGICGE